MNWQGLIGYLCPHFEYSKSNWLYIVSSLVTFLYCIQTSSAVDHLYGSKRGEERRGESLYNSTGPTSYSVPIPVCRCTAHWRQPQQDKTKSNRENIKKITKYYMKSWNLIYRKHYILFHVTRMIITIINVWSENNKSIEKPISKH